MNTASFSVDVGLRIRHARDLLGHTQDEVSEAMGFNDRQTLSEIENGRRSVKSDELMRFSDVLDQDLEFFVDPFSVVGEAKYSWRANRELPEEVLNSFEAKAAGWVGMLRWLRSQSEAPSRALSFHLPLDARSTFETVQARAEMLVRQLKLGLVPAQNLAQCIEDELGISVLYVDTPEALPYGYGAISGAACHLTGMGVVLVARGESTGRRNFDLGHELFHILTWDKMKPEHRESNSIDDRQRGHRVETLADNFAAALLMPTSSLNALIDPVRSKNVPHLAEVAGRLQVTTQALGWRLKVLGRIDESTREALARVKADAGETPKLFSEKFVGQLHFALDRGRLSARKAAKALNMSLSELYALFQAYGLSDPFRS